MMESWEVVPNPPGLPSKVKKSPLFKDRVPVVLEDVIDKLIAPEVGLIVTVFTLFIPELAAMVMGNVSTEET